MLGWLWPLCNQTVAREPVWRPLFGWSCLDVLALEQLGTAHSSDCILLQFSRTLSRNTKASVTAGDHKNAAPSFPQDVFIFVFMLSI